MVVYKVAISIQVCLDIPRQSVYFISFDKALDGEVEAYFFLASIVQTAFGKMEQPSEAGVTRGAVLLLYSGATKHRPALCIHRNRYPVTLLRDIVHDNVERLFEPLGWLADFISQVIVQISILTL
jgi:hypothetical protein